MILQQEIKKVQSRAARFVSSYYCFKTESMIGILEKLKCESLKKSCYIFHDSTIISMGSLKRQ